MNEQFVSFPPKSHVLRACIDHYYFHRSADDRKSRAYLYYPHYKNALSIYKDSDLIRDARFSTIAKPGKKGYAMGYSKLIKHAAKAEIHAPFDKIGVVFQPLGLNAFLDGPLSEFVHEPINLYFDYFQDAMHDTLDRVYQTDDPQRKVELLDDFFLAAYKGFSEDKLVEAVKRLRDSDGETDFSVEELAENVGVSRKTLLRLFRKHLNCTVIDYLKIIRFRKAIESYHGSSANTSLTQLAHGNNYYDQSELIHHFRQLTGFRPKLFFKNLTRISEHGTYWTFD